MKITEIEIKNFRGIELAKFSLLGNLNVFVGINGSGKSSILDAIAISLSWLVNRIQRENTPGRPIQDSSIKNDTPYSSISIDFEESGKLFKWKIAKTARGNVGNEKSELTEVSYLAKYFQEILQNNATLPVLAYYPINRVVDSFFPRSLELESLNILDVYKNALYGRPNYQSFFEWFREQDDIINEKAQSRSKWMIKNKGWLNRKTEKLLSYLIEMTEGNNNEEDNIEIKQFIYRFKNDELIFEDPRYLFHELTDLLHTAEFRNRKAYKFGEVFHDIDYLFHRMSSLSDSKKDNVINIGKFPNSIIIKIVEKINDILHHEEQFDDYKIVVSFIWESLSFAILLSLWWLSEKGKKDIEKLFFEYIPFENTRRNFLLEEYEHFVYLLNKIMEKDVERFDKATKSEGRELKFVSNTIEKFIPGYSNLRITRTPRPHMLVEKDGETISLDQLSDGEKNLIALVGDIARRLTMANTNSNNPLQGNGIILIDEIDLHLHPGWQRLMIPQLRKLFPNCQFIITTHSPQVLSHIHPESIFLLSNEKGNFTYNKAIESFGKNSDRILEDLLGVDARPKEQKVMLHKLFLSIQDGDLEKAKKEVTSIKNLIGEDPELVKANVLIKRKEIIKK